MAVLVHREVTDDDQRRRLVGDDGRASHERTQPGDDLLEAERLGHVVVATGREPGDPVLDGVLGGEEEDGDGVVVGAHPAQHLEPVEVGQHHVEHDRVGLEVARSLDRLDPGAGRAHLPALVAQSHRQQLGEVGLVVDDEDADGAAVGALEPGGRGR